MFDNPNTSIDGEEYGRSFWGRLNLADINKASDRCSSSRQPVTHIADASWSGFTWTILSAQHAALEAAIAAKQKPSRARRGLKAGAD